jgi:hypothetical protein
VPPSATATFSEPQGTLCSSWAKVNYFLSEVGHIAIGVMAMLPCGVSCVQVLECMVSAVRGQDDGAPRKPKAPCLMMQTQPQAGNYSNQKVGQFCIEHSLLQAKASMTRARKR